MTKENAIIVAIILILASLLFLFLACYMAYTKKKLKSLSGKTQGKVNGLVHNGLFKNTNLGNVDTKVLASWSVAHGEQRWGWVLRMSIPPYLPCISYLIDGNEYVQISGEGTTRNKWKIGQEITVLYDPSNPRRHIIEGDDSYNWTIALQIGLFVLLNIVAAIFIIVV